MTSRPELIISRVISSCTLNILGKALRLLIIPVFIAKIKVCDEHEDFEDVLFFQLKGAHEWYTRVMIKLVYFYFSEVGFSLLL